MLSERAGDREWRQTVYTRDSSPKCRYDHTKFWRERKTERLESAPGYDNNGSTRYHCGISCSTYKSDTRVLHND